MSSEYRRMSRDLMSDVYLFITTTEYVTGILSGEEHG